MIKIFVLNFLRAAGFLGSYVYRPKINEKWMQIKRHIYSAWISREFKAFGKESLVDSIDCLVGAKYITIGRRCGIGRRSVLTAWSHYNGDSFSPEIVLGDNVSIGSECHITAINGIYIGDDVLTGLRVTITDNYHGTTDIDSISEAPINRALYSRGPVHIENGVWLGDNVVVLSGVRIGANSIIGANAVVTRDIPSNSVAVGVPAVVVKTLKNDICP